MQQVSSTELKEWIDSKKEFLLVDVRDEWEREVFDIGGVHIPFGSIIIRQAEIPKDKDVVFYCEKGIRSILAIQRLEELGYTNLYNLAGGIKAWKLMPDDAMAQ
jgi:rhodanese-related sulfurtransferase